MSRGSSKNIKSDCHIDSIISGDSFYRNQALIMVVCNITVKRKFFAFSVILSGLDKKSVRRKWIGYVNPFFQKRFHGRIKNIKLFFAKNTILAAVRVKCAQRKFWRCDTEMCPEKFLQILNFFGYQIFCHPNSFQCAVACKQKYPEIFCNKKCKRTTSLGIFDR